MSEFAQNSDYPWRGTKGYRDRVWLISSFRVRIIKQGIDKAGSINKLGRELGYRSRVHPGWSIRQILMGKQAFPLERLKKLANYLEYPLEEIMEHQASERRVTLASTRKALQECGLYLYIPR